MKRFYLAGRWFWLKCPEFEPREFRLVILWVRSQKSEIAKHHLKLQRRQLVATIANSTNPLRTCNEGAVSADLLPLPNLRRHVDHPLVHADHDVAVLDVDLHLHGAGRQTGERRGLGLGQAHD